MSRFLVAQTSTVAVYRPRLWLTKMYIHVQNNPAHWYHNVYLFISRVQDFKSWLGTIAYWPLASYLQMCASVTKYYNLLPVKDRLRFAAGTVTIGLMSHWPCVIDLLVVYAATRWRLKEGRWLSCLCSCKGVWHNLPYLQTATRTDKPIGTRINGAKTTLWFAGARTAMNTV